MPKYKKRLQQNEEGPNESQSNTRTTTSDGAVLRVSYRGMELTQRLEDRINAFEMWIYRRMLRISWMDRVTNTEVLTRVNTGLTSLHISVRKENCSTSDMSCEMRSISASSYNSRKNRGTTGTWKKKNIVAEKLEPMVWQKYNVAIPCHCVQRKIAVMIANLR